MLTMENGRNNYLRETISWCMYDWGNSAYATVVISAILPVYFSKVVASELLPAQATIYWSYTITISLLIGAVIAPAMGAIADNTSKKKLFLSANAAVGIIFTALLYYSESGRWLYVCIIFIISNIGFSLSDIFYNSLLKFVARPDDVNRVSSLGYALGYFGGGLMLGLCIIYFYTFEDQGLAARISFLSVAVWWAVFTLPLILNVTEPKVTKGHSRKNPLLSGFIQLKNTFHEIRRYRNLFLFLLAFWIYNDGIGTIIKLAAIYGSEIGLDSMTLIGALLVTQIVGIPFTILFGRMASAIGTKNSIYVGLTVYTMISVAAFFMQTALHFWILAIAVGTVQGGTQALSRSFFSNLVPEKKSSEFFGFYGMSTKFAGIFGPLTFALISQLTGSSRLSIISLVIFFVTGIIVLSVVDENAVADRSRTF